MIVFKINILIELLIIPTSPFFSLQQRVPDINSTSKMQKSPEILDFLKSHLFMVPPRGLEPLLPP